MIREACPDDWAVWRELRLRSLHEDPQAFASSVTAWTGVRDTEANWRERLASDGVCLIAYVDDHPVGMAGGMPVADGIELISMWVAPEARGKGAGRALVDGVLAWAAHQGANAPLQQGSDSPSIRLRVMDGNGSAIVLYEECGFVLEPGCPDAEGCRAMTHSP